jgi:hypothetical protein
MIQTLKWREDQLNQKLVSAATEIPKTHLVNFSGALTFCSGATGSGTKVGKPQESLCYFNLVELISKIKPLLQRNWTHVAPKPTPAALSSNAVNSHLHTIDRKLFNLWPESGWIKEKTRSCQQGPSRRTAI